MSSQTLEEQVLGDLRNHLAWNRISKKYHISTKTISKIRSASSDTGAGQSSGEVAAKAFELFNQGKRPVAAVIALKQSPDTINALYEKWVAMRGAWLVPRQLKEDLIGEIEANMWEGDVGAEVDGPADVLKFFLQAVQERNACKTFWYKCSVCDKLIEAEPDREWKSVLDSHMHLGGWGHNKCLAH